VLLFRENAAVKSVFQAQPRFPRIESSNLLDVNECSAGMSRIPDKLLGAGIDNISLAFIRDYDDLMCATNAAREGLRAQVLGKVRNMMLLMAVAISSFSIFLPSSRDTRGALFGQSFRSCTS